MLGFVEHRVGGIHQERVGDGESCQRPAGGNRASSGEKREEADCLGGGDEEVQPRWKLEFLCHGQR